MYHNYSELSVQDIPVAVPSTVVNTTVTSRSACLFSSAMKLMLFPSLAEYVTGLNCTLKAARKKQSKLHTPQVHPPTMSTHGHCR